MSAAPKNALAAVSSAASQATNLVRLALALSKLVHDDNGDVYAIDRVTGGVRSIERRAFQQWITAVLADCAQFSRGRAYALAAGPPC